MIPPLPEGNPLFIEQLAASVGEPSRSPGRLPTNVREIVARTPGRAAAPRSARCCSTPPSSARSFWLEAVRHHERRPQRPRAAARAPRASRSRPPRDRRRSSKGQHQFAFTHVLIRDVAYDPPAPRRPAGAAARPRRPSLPNTTPGVSGEANRRAGPPLDRRRLLRTRRGAARPPRRNWPSVAGRKTTRRLLYREAFELVPGGDDGDQLVQMRRRLALAVAAAVHIPDARQLIAPAGR